MIFNLDILNVQPPKANTPDPVKKQVNFRVPDEVKAREEFQTRKNKIIDHDNKSETTDFSSALADFRSDQTSQNKENNSFDFEIVSASLLTKQVQTKTDKTPENNDDILQYIIKNYLSDSELLDLQDSLQKMGIKIDLVNAEEIPPEVIDALRASFPEKFSNDTRAIETTLSAILNTNIDIKDLLKSLKESVPEMQLISVDDPVKTSELSTVNGFKILAIFYIKEEDLRSIEGLSFSENGKLLDFSEMDFADKLALLDKILQKSSTESNVAVLLFNITPQELTDIQISIDKATLDQASQDEIEAIEAFMTQILILISPPKSSEAMKPEIKTDKAAKAELPPALLSMPEISTAKSLPAPVVSEKHFSQVRYDARYEQTAQTNEAAHDLSDSQFKVALKDASNQVLLKPSIDQALSSQKLQNLALTSLDNGLTLASQNPSLLTTAATPAQIAAQSIQTSLSNPVTQAQSAAYPHPATQLVAATIHKAVKNGQETDIRLQLDPPELGRVEVKMSIGKDSKAKIVLTAEKSDTLFLLQRDAQILDRALQSAGLDTQNGSLSFELAHDNHFDGRQRNGDSGGRNKGNNDAANDLIEAKMDWYVDPNTGVMHYNVLV